MSRLFRRDNINNNSNSWKGSAAPNHGVSRFLKRTLHAENKNHFCPNCKKNFDINYRLPVLFSCSHTVCEECLTISRVCSICNVGILSPNIALNNREDLPINYYIVGQLYCRKFRSMLSQQASQPPQIPFVSSWKNENASDEFDQKCMNCTQSATLRCLDCVELYCDTCSEAFHQAKGLKIHKLFSLNVLECAEHTPNIKEFKCVDCDKIICSYCAISDHNGHKMDKITQLNEQDVARFTILLRNCETARAHLEYRNKKLQNLQINTNSAYSNNSSQVTNDIKNCFILLHSKLQLIESNLIQKIETTKSDCLKERKETILVEIAKIDKIIRESKNILSNSTQIKYSISDIVEKMENIPKVIDKFQDLDINCNVKFECGDILRTLENNFSIIMEQSTSKKSSATTLTDDTSSESSISLSVTRVKKSGTKLAYSPHHPKFNHPSGSMNCMKSPHSQSQVSDQGIDSDTSRTFSFKPKKKNKFYQSELPSIDTMTRNEFKRSAKECVIGTYVENPDKICVQLTKHSKHLKKLQQLINEYQNGKRYPAKALTLNSMYIVKNNARNIKQKWCRGVLISEGNNTFKLNLIDYGNTIDVKNTSIFDIPPDLSTIPKFAYDCKIYGIYPTRNTWGPDANIIVKELLLNMEVFMYVFDDKNGIIEVDFIAYSENSEFSVRDSLMLIGVAKNFDAKDDDVEPLILPKEKSGKRKLKFFKNSCDYTNGTKLDVQVMHIIDPFNIYVQLWNHKEKLEILHKEMQGQYNLIKRGFVFNPEIDMAVAVQNPKEQTEWFRGQIKNVVHGEGKVTVFLIDFGDTIIVNWDKIRVMQEKFITLQSQAILVRLAHIEKKSETWSSKCMGLLSSSTEVQTPLKMVIEDNGYPLTVVLFEIKSDVDICLNAQLVRANLANSTGELSQIVEWPKEPSEESEETKPEFFTYNLLRMSQGYNEESDSDNESTKFKRKPVKVLNVQNPGCIYLHFFKDEAIMKKLKNLHYQLQEFYSENALKPKEDLKEGDFCVALDIKKSQYHRVRIESKINEQYQVFSRDYGYSFIASHENIGRIEDSFCTFPPFAYRCHMFGVKPNGNDWTLTSADYLKDCLMSRNDIYFTRLGNPEEPLRSTPGLFWYKEFVIASALERSKYKMHNINKLLIKNGLAIKCSDWNEHVQKIEEGDESDHNLEELVGEYEQKVLNVNQNEWYRPLPIESDFFYALSTYVDEDAKIYFHYPTEVEQLTEMETEITKAICDSSIQDDVDWSIGDRCTVKYRNNKWYRGIVVEVFSNSLKVCMVDYGNVEEVKFNEISTKLFFQNRPIVAKTVKLYQVYPKNGIYHTKELDGLHHLVVDKKIHIFIKQRGNPPYAIVHQGCMNINESMIQHFDNCVKEPILQVPHSDDDDDNDVLIENSGDINTSSKSSDSSMNDLTFNSPNLPDDIFKGTLINSMGYNTIVFMRDDDEAVDSEEFKEVLKNIQEEAETQPEISNPKLNEPCIAKYKEDNCWYRGMIYEINDSNYITVLFVDYGNCDNVSKTDVRAVKPVWLVHEVKLYIALLDRFGLADENHKNTCSETCYNKVYRIKVVKRDPLTVQLFDVD